MILPPKLIRLVMACCVLHWTLYWGLDEYVPKAEDVISNHVESGHGVKAHDNEVWKIKILEWPNTIWAN